MYSHHEPPNNNYLQMNVSNFNIDDIYDPNWKPISLPCLYCKSPVLLSFNFCNVCGAKAPSISNSKNSDVSPQGDGLGSTHNLPIQSHQAVEKNFNLVDINDCGHMNSLNDSEHNKDQVCKFHTLGKCKNGKDCKYMHDALYDVGCQNRDSIPSNSSETSEEVSNEQVILTAVAALGLIPSQESINTVDLLIKKLLLQINGSDQVAAEKARATLTSLTSRAESSQRRQSLAAAEGAPSRNLYVHGFGAEVDEAAVEALFSLFCEVKCVVMKQVLNKSTGEVEGRYCFVWTAAVEQATKAKEGLDQYNLNGNLLQVSFAKERSSPLEDVTRRLKETQEGSPERERGPSETSVNSSPHRPSRNLFVANFIEGTSPDEIARIFSAYCEVKRVIMKSSGYCFVWTGGEDQAMRALNALNGQEINGSVIQVAYAKEAKRNEDRRSTKLPVLLREPINSFFNY